MKYSLIVSNLIIKIIKPQTALTVHTVAGDGYGTGQIAISEMNAVAVKIKGFIFFPVVTVLFLYTVNGQYFQPVYRSETVTVFLKLMVSGNFCRNGR